MNNTLTPSPYSWAGEIIEAFGPDVQEKDIAAALWYYTREDLQKILWLAESNLPAATDELLEARRAADQKFGEGWKVRALYYRDRKNIRPLEKRGLTCEQDGILQYWIIPTRRKRRKEN